jgi:hypothetical protein
VTEGITVVPRTVLMQVFRQDRAPVLQPERQVAEVLFGWTGVMIGPAGAVVVWAIAASLIPRKATIGMIKHKLDLMA